MNQKKTPLFDELTKHYHSSPTSFHVPGHKNGRVFFEKGKEAFANILSLDQTEIKGLDNLHEPAGVIDEAEQLTAELYGTMSSYFLVGGSTVGNLVMIMTIAKRGETVLVQRNSHQSVFHGIELVGVRPVFLEPEKQPETGLYLGVSLNTLKQALVDFPDAVAVLLTSPTYEGYAQSLVKHVRATHDAGLFLCVDEAHGAHLIHKPPAWPQSALKAGADLVVQSAHKTLPAMTMAAFLHRNSPAVDVEKLRLSLRMLQSSSPSYPLLASLDVARAYLAALTKREWHQITETITTLKSGLAKGEGWFQTPIQTGNYLQDPLKLVFATTYKGAAFQWKQRMEAENSYPEFCSPQHMLLTLPLSSVAVDVEKWTSFFQRILTFTKGDSDCFQMRIQPDVMYDMKKPFSQMALSFEDMAKRERVNIPWQESKGFVSAETITPYPPGIPLILKGERINEDKLAILTKLVQEQASFQTGTSWVKNGILIFLHEGE